MNYTKNIKTAIPDGQRYLKMGNRMVKPSSSKPAKKSIPKRDPETTTDMEDDFFDLDVRVATLLSRSLDAFLAVATVALIILSIRVHQYEITALIGLKIMLCAAGITLILLRRFLSIPLVFGGGVFLTIIVCGFGLVEFGLVSPALVALPVIPIIIGCIYGLKPALMTTLAITALIAITGVLYVSGQLTTTNDLNNYMTRWSNWTILVIMYFSGVTWGSTLAATLTESWKIAIQERKRAEQQTLKERELVEKLQRQQSIGQLSAGVAHDFNNILAAITFNLEVAKSSNDQNDSEEFNESMDAAFSATEKGSELTRSLVSFAKVAVLEPKTLEINDVIEQSLQWITRTIPANISIDLLLGESLPVIEVDETALSSALLNLIINARDAMPDGGIIQIRTSLKTIPDNIPEYANIDITSGDYVELSITDSGTGIALSDHGRIFEPFYSTKDPGKGSGLGLAMVQGFMKQSGGGVILESEPGKGTTFNLLFKAHSSRPTERIRSEEPASLVTRGNATLMVIDDEPAILDAVARMLRDAGYKVRTAVSGDLAWYSLKTDSSVDLVLSDVVMPGNLQGIDLARNIKESLPHIPVILTTGYPLSFEHEKDRPPVDRFLHKPIRKHELLKAIEITLYKSNITKSC